MMNVCLTGWQPLDWDAGRPSQPNDIFLRKRPVIHNVGVAPTQLPKVLWDITILVPGRDLVRVGGWPQLVWLLGSTSGLACCLLFQSSRLGFRVPTVTMHFTMPPNRGFCVFRIPTHIRPSCFSWNRM